MRLRIDKQDTRSLRAALIALALVAAVPATAAPLLVTVQKRDGKPLSGAVITAEPEVAPTPAPALHAIMDQVNLAFVPDVLVIPVHSTVQFPNSDAVSHQVYSFSSARQFQLPLYRGKPYPPVQFDQAGVITLGCNIHDNMLGYIVVTAAPYFGRSDARGEFSVADLPAGRYRVRAWHPLLNEAAQPERLVEIRVTRETVEFRLARPLRPAPLTDRPHSWDY
ncbi:MAG TPA: carboxypeptidase regulatory-like domain-containing protein [Candidatus Krumholzibacteria bacterium]|nr:carboxypeptidase regulatory-like domain-containing protein [Candidatus Krumholzibacteria bacterium]